MTTDTNAIIWEKHPELKNPLFVAAFEGWNDGGTASTNAIKRMIDTFDAERFAMLDPEPFYVFSENRPTVQLVEGGLRKIDWQKNEFYHARIPNSDRDLILFSGVEPNLLWRTYCANLMTVAQHQGASSVTTLGAYLADVLYTLPVQVTGFSSDPSFEEKFSLRRSNYEGPTGIVGVFTDYCRQHAMQTLSLWAAVPYYISIPNPKAVHSLLSKLREVYAFDMDLAALEKDADNFDNEINDVVAKDPNVAAYVRELKKREFLN